MIFNQDNSDLVNAITHYNYRGTVNPANLSDSWLLTAENGEYKVEGSSAAGGFLEGIDTSYGVMKVVITPDFVAGTSPYGYIVYYSNYGSVYQRVFRRDANAIAWRYALKRLVNADEFTITTGTYTPSGNYAVNAVDSFKCGKLVTFTFFLQTGSGGSIHAGDYTNIGTINLKPISRTCTQMLTTTNTVVLLDVLDNGTVRVFPYNTDAAGTMRTTISYFTND